MAGGPLHCRMNFVRSSVYVQEFTQNGIKEQEIDARDPKEREEEERLKRLPEFSKGWSLHFLLNEALSCLSTSLGFYHQTQISRGR